MDLNNSTLIQQVQDKLLLDLAKLASSEPKSSISLEKPEKSLDLSLLRLLRECLLVWGQLFNANFKEVYEFLLSEGVNFPKKLMFFKEEKVENIVLDKINACKTEVLNTSSNEEIMLFVLENKLESLNNLLEISPNNSHSKEFDSKIKRFLLENSKNQGFFL